jgi:hypothetical protein
MTVPGGRGDPRVGTVVIGRDRRLRAQIGLIAGLGLLVVLVGVGLGGPEDESARPTPSVTAGAGGPSGTPGRPSDAIAAGCRTVTDRNAPAVRLRSTSGDQGPVIGSAGPSPSSDQSGAPALNAWPVPGLDRGVLLPSDASLILDTARSACISAVSIAAADAGAAAGPRAVEPRVVRPADGPGGDADIGTLPPGDWVVRVEVAFTGLVETRVAFFRVVSSDVPVLAPSPEVTPAVACGADPVGAASPDLGLAIDDGRPIPADRTSTAKPIEVDFGQSIEVRSIGDVCARTWSIELADVIGNVFLQDSYENLAGNPFIAAQNRWPLTQLLTGRSSVTATVGFGRDRESTGTWHLRLVMDALPAARAVGPDGASVAALAGCGQDWSLPGGRAAFEPCLYQTVPDGLDVLEIATGTSVRIDVDGWTIQSWYARCGEANSLGSEIVEFVIVDECDLGERSSPGAIAIVPWPGERLVLIGITAERGGVAASGSYYVRIHATP